MQHQPGRLRIAHTCKPWNGAPVSESVLQAFGETIGLLRELGHELTEVSPPIDWDAVVGSVLATGAVHRLLGGSHGVHGGHQT